MAFEAKSLFKNPAFAIGGGFVLGMGVWHALAGIFDHVIRPVFAAMGSGVISMGDLRIGCFGFILALMLGVVGAVAGLVMIKIASRE